MGIEIDVLEYKVEQLEKRLKITEEFTDFMANMLHGHFQKHEKASELTETYLKRKNDNITQNIKLPKP